jgi:hypothetical protein
MDERLNAPPPRASILARASRIFRREPGTQPRSAHVSRDPRAEPDSTDAITEQRHTPNAAIAAQREWRTACTEVRRAYRSWARSPAGNAGLRYLVYTTALDREQAAAEQYARLAGTLGQPAEADRP